MKTIILKPNEYQSISTLKAMTNGSNWVSKHGLIITKDGSKTPVRTPFTVDSDCEIELTYNEEKNYGRVKYLKSTPRRKYFVFLRWYIIILQLLAIIAVLYEVNVNGNYLVKGSKAETLALPFIITWLSYNIVHLRNTNTITKKIITLFSYMLLILSTIQFIRYIIGLF